MAVATTDSESSCVLVPRNTGEGTDLPGNVPFDDIEGSSLCSGQPSQKYPKPVPPTVVIQAPAEDRITSPTPPSDCTKKDIESPPDDNDALDLDEDEPVAARVFQISGFVRVGGAVLALCAGMVNSIAFFALSTFVSHQTGTLSKVGIGLEDDAEADAGKALLLVVSFVLGSTFTGFLIGKNTIHFGAALYDLCLLTECALLVCTTFFHEYKLAAYLAAAACGLQNGMATHWGGAVVRTTHVTGLFTDVGLLFGRLLSLSCRKRCGAKFDHFDRAFVEDDLSKLSVLLTIAACFTCGIFVGAHFYNVMRHLAFLVPAGITGSIGCAYLVYRVGILRKHLFSDEEMEVIDVPVDIQTEVIAADMERRLADIASPDDDIDSPKSLEVRRPTKSRTEVMSVSRNQMDQWQRQVSNSDGWTRQVSHASNVGALHRHGSGFSSSEGLQPGSMLDPGQSERHDDGSEVSQRRASKERRRHSKEKRQFSRECRISDSSLVS